MNASTLDFPTIEQVNHQAKEIDANFTAAKLKLDFERNFREELALLRHNGISWKAGFNDPTNASYGTYIEFSRDEKIVRMDYTFNQWRYEHAPRTSSKSATMVYDRWPKPQFLSYIHDNLLKF